MLHERIGSDDLRFLDDETIVSVEIKNKFFVLCDDGHFADSRDAGDAMEIAAKVWQFLDHPVHKPFSAPLITVLHFLSWVIRRFCALNFDSSMSMIARGLEHLQKLLIKHH